MASDSVASPSQSLDAARAATQMEFSAEIAKALVALQTEVHGMGKTAKNDHFKNTYAPLDEVMDTALPLLTKNKLALTSWPITVAGKHYLHVVLMHEGGSTVQSDIELLVTRADPQSLGSAITYERRQTTMAILGLSAKDEDDDGNKASNRSVPPTQAQLDEIATVCGLLKFPPEEVELRLRNVKTSDQAVLALSNLNKIVEQRAAAIKARKASESAAAIEVGDGESDDQTRSIAKRLQALRLKDDATVRLLIRNETGKPFLKSCKAEDLAKLEKALDDIESGKRKLPADLYAPTEEATIVEEPTA